MDNGSSDDIYKKKNNNKEENVPCYLFCNFDFTKCSTS